MTGSAPGATAESAPKRWSANRKKETVLRLLRGEPVEALSRELGVEIYPLHVGFRFSECVIRAPGQDIATSHSGDYGEERQRSHGVKRACSGAENSRITGIYRLEGWRDNALAGMDASLKARHSDPLEAKLNEATRGIGELVMENELLRREREVWCPPMQNALSSTRSCTSARPARNGGCCPRSFPPRRRCMTSPAIGTGAECGKPHAMN